MANFDVEQMILFNNDNLLNDNDMMLLLLAQRGRRNLHYEQPYWQYDAFNLERMDENECLVEFRFKKEDIYSLVNVFQLPDVVRCENGVVVDSVEALCIFLKRFAYPCRYVDLIPRFARPISQLCMACNLVTDMIYDRFNHLLTDLNQPWLSRQNLQLFANAIHAKGAALDNCWGFIDGTVRPISSPNNGNKRVHALKYQSVVTPNGLIANLYGPVEGRRHDSAMLAMSDLPPQLEQHSFSPDGQALCIYGDPAYPLRVHLQSPFRRAPLTPEQQLFNESMSQVRVSVEWVFGDVVNYFKFIDFKKNLKIGLSSVGKMYSVCALLRNALTCLYGSTTSSYFNMQPPALNEYFQ